MRREFCREGRDHRIYVYDQTTGRIQRIRIEYLDTVKALDPEEWEEVKA